ncbi:hypothetical protein CT122_07365 [Pseudomonas syringae pv. actinidiae]|uniref:Uncharacterized protein n=1 Tax=Pseudomonas syringae pv. actinidiae TaxID=103796 RepID=A0AAU8XE94_PSESF|nr:hypothetical protein CT122_07365 [Pseudomonas syringae pv. actinidiae]
MLAPEKNWEHSIKLQLPAGNVGFMRRLQSIDRCVEIKSSQSFVKLDCFEMNVPSDEISAMCVRREPQHLGDMGTLTAANQGGIISHGAHLRMPF